jgi:hypothetical protein
LILRFCYPNREDGEGPHEHGLSSKPSCVPQPDRCGPSLALGMTAEEQSACGSCTSSQRTAKDARPGSAALHSVALPKLAPGRPASQGPACSIIARAFARLRYAFKLSGASRTAFFASELLSHYGRCHPERYAKDLSKTREQLRDPSPSTRLRMTRHYLLVAKKLRDISRSSFQ